MSSLDIIWMLLAPPRRKAPGFAVENARKMSPEPLPPVPPVLPTPSEMRCAMRRS
jgi:hypothetical protein